MDYNKITRKQYTDKIDILQLKDPNTQEKLTGEIKKEISKIQTENDEYASEK